MKRWAICTFSVAVLFFVCARSYAEEHSNVFHAIIVDQLDVTSRVQNLSFQPNYLSQEVVAKYMLYGWRGNAEITIPWRIIARIDFTAPEPRFNAVVTLRDGRTVPMRIESANSEYRGTNDYGGIFIIKTEFIRTIIFEVGNEW